MATAPTDTLFPDQARLALLLVIAPPVTDTLSAATDYGLDVGLPRLLALFASHQLRASVLVGADLLDQRPDLLAQLVAAGHELAAHCASTDLPTLLPQLRLVEGAVVQGWQALDPADDVHVDPAQLLAAGVSYRLREARTETPLQQLCSLGTLVDLPLTPDADDLAMAPWPASDAWLQHLIDSFDTLHDEATPGEPRLLGLTLHPQIIGRPGRIKALEQFLSYARQQEGVWCAPGGAIALASSQPLGEG